MALTLKRIERKTNAPGQIGSKWPITMQTLTPVEKAHLHHGYRVVLLSTGSYNPVHRMHEAMLSCAKSHLESLRHVVVGGFMSPSHDDHIRKKMKKNPKRETKAGDLEIDARHRLAMCRLAGTLLPCVLCFACATMHLRNSGGP